MLGRNINRIGGRMTEIKITVTGIEKIQAGLNRFPHEIEKYLTQAGDEAAKRQILNTVGVQKYPPAGPANAPPTPYYIRGIGTQTQSGNRGNSERLGTQWYVEKQGLGTEIGNRASYGRWVHGDEQAHFMKPKGWRILREVAEEKIDKITKVYQAWINKCIRDLGL
jgi:hypothetical protein